jgi:hypothetical protein
MHAGRTGMDVNADRRRLSVRVINSNMILLLPAALLFGIRPRAVMEQGIGVRTLEMATLDRLTLGRRIGPCVCHNFDSGYAR